MFLSIALDFVNISRSLYFAHLWRDEDLILHYCPYRNRYGLCVFRATHHIGATTPSDVKKMVLDDDNAALEIWETIAGAS